MVQLKNVVWVNKTLCCEEQTECISTLGKFECFSGKHVGVEIKHGDKQLS